MADDSNIITKVCTKCGVSQPATREFFFASKLGRFGLKAVCKQCALRYNKEWFRADYQRDPQKRLADGKAWRKRHQEAYRQRQRERQREGGSRAEEHKRWSDANRPRVRAEKRVTEQRRRAAKRHAVGSHTNDDITSLVRMQGGRCFYCSEPMPDGYHVDHFVPLVRGGTNGADNLVIACPPCNLKKHTKLPWEWMPDRFPVGCGPRYGDHANA